MHLRRLQNLYHLPKNGLMISGIPFFGIVQFILPNSFVAIYTFVQSPYIQGPICRLSINNDILNVWVRLIHNTLNGSRQMCRGIETNGDNTYAWIGGLGRNTHTLLTLWP